ncbi:MAG: cation transporter, partial [Caulobacteraceae bacterium]|nr:cation transporter [Caulobacteraceae bacterium]
MAGGHHHDHDDHDHHRHGPGGHSHAPASFGGAFLVGIALNAGYVAAEAAYGLLANSLALLADAGHNLGDVLALGVAWLASRLARRAPSPRYTYGLRGSTILAAVTNAAVLLLVTGGIGWAAILRLVHPSAAAGPTIMVVAGVGVVVNAVTAWMFAAGREGDVNRRAAFLHMAYDALVALGVVASGGVILLTGWRWVDPVASLAVGAVIVAGAWGLMRESLDLAMHAVPQGIDRDAVLAYLEGLPGVSEVHDLHIWGMSTTETALTCHLVMPHGHPGDIVLNEMAQHLHRRFGIQHATIQIKLADSDEACALTP